MGLIMEKLNISFIGSYFSREDAENVREKIFKSLESQIISEGLHILEDEIKFINHQYVVRILLGQAQKELEFD